MAIECQINHGVIHEIKNGKDAGKHLLKLLLSNSDLVLKDGTKPDNTQWLLTLENEDMLKRAKDRIKEIKSLSGSAKALTLTFEDEGLILTEDEYKPHRGPVQVTLTIASEHNAVFGHKQRAVRGGVSNL